MGFFRLKIFRKKKRSAGASGDRNEQIIAFVKECFGFRPIDISLYELALKHKSRNEEVTENNERLEFLGDSVLDSIVAEYLFEKYPSETEGFLTKMRAKIVSRKTLNAIAIRFGLEQMVDAHVEHDPKSTSLGGNALEAIIGAIYLEKGFEFAKRVVRSHLLERHIQLSEFKQREFDPKSRVIERVQKVRGKIDFQTIEDAEEESSQKHYISRVFIDGEERGLGRGTSKKKAEQEAASQALDNWPAEDLPE